MPSITSFSIDKLARLIGTPACPAIVDVRTAEDFDAKPLMVPGSVRRSHRDVADWAGHYAGRPVVVVCQQGHKLSHGVAAWLRHAGAASAESLEGGSEAWMQAGMPCVPVAKLPPRDALGRTLWVTRERPKIDRIACPWLIRRFVDPAAVVLFVKPSEVAGVASRFDAAPFDVEDVFWSHRGELCTFDVMLEELGLTTPALSHLARIVRAADTGRLDLEPQAAGLLAASLGLSRLHADDLAQLEAGMVLYDAFHRWCRDATDETHNWPTNRAGA
jgi:rhodanese-related sulfurtransferase